MIAVKEADVNITRPEDAKIVPLPVVLSVFALIFSTGAVLWSVLHDPLGHGLSHYDLSTPTAAYKSYLEICASKDYKAKMELAELTSVPSLEETLRTFRVCKEAPWRGKMILFCCAEKDGVPERTCEALEKDAKTGCWLPSGMPWVFDVEKTGSEEDNRFSKMIERWKESGTF